MDKIWNGKFSWIEFIDKIKDLNIYKVDIDECIHGSEKLSNEMMKIFKSGNQDINSWDVTKNLKEEFQNFSKLFNLIYLIVKSKMVKRHWDYIQRIIDWKFDFTSDYFNIHNLNMKSFIKHEYQILDVIELASTEEIIKKVGSLIHSKTCEKLI